MSHHTPLQYLEMDSPLGPITGVSTRTGLCALHYGQAEKVKKRLIPWLKRYHLPDQLEYDTTDRHGTMRQLREYFSGKRREFDIPLDLYGTPFQLAVWHALAVIPYGETRSYKEIAEDIQAPKAVRAVGSANNKNPVSLIIPCHRVIGSGGKMVGYGGGLDKKEYLLKMEGALPGLSS
ncbi:methylated-DNA--[protein]-cysteine S-methyltransferase [Salibacterium aidingense]|uniref:methylated-DNA--[protein]-cysteine S-methyltransferase n=1 Tax=Salibacterium aidingense TaxID=384933 RepID=UPI003BC8A2E4